MKKANNWLRKWSFFIILGGMGIVFFAWEENREACAKPLKEAVKWYQEKTYYLTSNLTENTLVGVEEKESFSESEKEKEENQSETQNQEISSEQYETQDKNVQNQENGIIGETIEQPENPITEGEAKTEETAENQEPTKEVTYRPSEEIVWKSVEDTYFEDAVFIGDSRTVGLFEYAGLEETATFYASTGLTVYKMFTEKIVEAEGENQKKTVEEALKENTFSKIYLMLGINEMGTGTVESFIEVYKEAVNYLRELQPDAIIYLQAIMKVTTERSNKGDYITNEGIDARNTEIAKLADNVNVFYLDVNPFLCDETGGMEASYTFDGVHLKARYISVWKDFLKTYAVDEELP